MWMKVIEDVFYFQMNHSYIWTKLNDTIIIIKLNNIKKIKLWFKMVEEDKKRKILDSALKLFVEKGIDNTSTSLISKEAGVAAGTLYFYFENKVDLISELGTSIKEESLKSFLEYYRLFR